MDLTDTKIAAAVIAAMIALVTALLGNFVGYRMQRRQFEMDRERDSKRIKDELQADLELHNEKIRTEFMAEQVARKLLEVKRWPLRSFAIIKHHLGGFSDDELRQILVKTGAIRFKSKSGHELWGLIERNKNKLSLWKVQTDPETVPYNELYGGSDAAAGPTYDGVAP